MDKMRELEAPPSPQGYSGMQADEPHRVRSGPGTIAAKVKKSLGSEKINASISICVL